MNQGPSMGRKGPPVYTLFESYFSGTLSSIVPLIAVISTEVISVDPSSFVVCTLMKLLAPE